MKKTTPNKQAYLKQEKRIKQFIRRASKRGYEFGEVLPERPQRYTKKSIERLQKMTPNKLYGMATASVQGEQVTGTVFREIERAKTREVTRQKRAVKKVQNTALQRVQDIQRNYDVYVTPEQEERIKEYVKEDINLETIGSLTTNDDIENIVSKAFSVVDIAEEKTAIQETKFVNNLVSGIKDDLNEILSYRGMDEYDVPFEEIMDKIKNQIRDDLFADFDTGYEGLDVTEVIDNAHNLIYNELSSLPPKEHIYYPDIVQLGVARIDEFLDNFDMKPSQYERYMNACDLWEEIKNESSPEQLSQFIEENYAEIVTAFEQYIYDSDPNSENINYNHLVFILHKPFGAYDLKTAMEFGEQRWDFYDETSDYVDGN